jgi:glutathione synthase/RimK-type ligase-like ATP-grasp enzyme
MINKQTLSPRNKIGLCFSKEFIGEEPLSHIGRKLPVYIRFLNLCQKQNWEVYVLTRKTYQGKGIFQGGWLFEKNKFKPVQKEIKIDLVYDRTAGVKFPIPNDELIVVNQLNFKKLCWDKWRAYQKVGDFMPKTVWVGEGKEISAVLSQIKTEWIVLKPFNGLKGLGIFIGPKKEALKFCFPKQFKKYIAQEFVDTANGIPQIVKGLHDLRIVIINGQPVWSHVRVPPKGGFKSNAAGGGVLKEVNYELVPRSIRKIVAEISPRFYREYYNPVFSLDFGLDGNGKPWLFEINDQIGFPCWEMKQRDVFLEELVKNFKEKLKESE